MNGLSSYFEYGRGIGFDGMSLCPQDPTWLSSGQSPQIWDMTYVNDGYGGTIRVRIAESYRGG